MDIPDLKKFGLDLTLTTSFQRWNSLLRPYLGLLMYALVSYYEWWWVTPVIVFYIFVTVVTVTHDVVHGSIGLTTTANGVGTLFNGSGPAREWSRLSNQSPATSSEFSERR